MSAVMIPSAVFTPWRRALVVLALVLVAIVLLYSDTFVAMVGIWTRSETFAHAWLVPAIVLWLVWRRREALAPFTPAPQPWIILPMGLVAGAWLVGDAAGINAATQLCVTALLVLAVPLILGVPIARQLTFPLVFLFFMVPIGEFLLPIMMEATADFTVAAVALSGVPVYREGLQFIIPTGSWSVVEACSGVRYLIASFMVGTLFAYLNYSSNWRRWAFVGVAILMPVLANWLRAYMIVMLGHLSGNTLAVGVDHLIYGWVFFGVVIGLMFFIGSRWSEHEAATPTPPQQAPGHKDLGLAAVGLVAAAAVAIVALPAVVSARLVHSPTLSPVVLVLPELPDMQPNEKPLLVPTAPGAVASASRVYGVGETAVTLHVSYFRQQSYSGKLAGSENLLVRADDKHWNRVSTVQTAVEAEGVGTVPMRSSQLLGAGAGSAAGRLLLESREFYWSGGRFTASGPWATVLGVLGRLTAQGDDAAIVTIYTKGETMVAKPRLDAFIASNLKALQMQLDLARKPR